MSENEGQVSRAEILPLLGPVKRSGGDTLAFCPVHGDGTKHGMKGGHSLVLHESGVLKCYAGCSFADVMKALRARAGQRPQRPASTPRTSREGFVQVSAYDYGVAVKGRFERPNPEGGKPEKTFRWRLHEGTYEEGLRGLQMTDIPLWGADQLVDVQAGTRIWFAEGESATQAIRARNEIALCGPWGASQREFGQAFEVLRGRDVILWPDNDPPGREYMAAVKRHLRGIAKSVVTVAAPVPPKGDAVEFFQANGSIADLLQNVIERPTVDVLASEHFIVRLPTDTAGTVAFEFDQMTKTSRSLDCELTVSLLTPGTEPEPYSLRINILSQTARGQLERALKEQFGKDANWTVIVSNAFAKVRAAFLEVERGKTIGQLPEMEEPIFAVSFAGGTGIAPLGQSTIWFGDGGSLKTHTAEAMLMAVALGGEFQGFAARHQGGAMLVDYEADGATFRFHCRRLLMGAGIDPILLDELPLFYWEAEGIPVTDQLEALQRFVQRNDVRLVVIDSGADACGGEPEKAEVALAYFNALSRLKVTNVTICHVTNQDATDASSARPFGSRFWHNRARRTWYVKRAQEEDSDELEVLFSCRKANTGRKPRPVAMKVHFDGTTGPVAFAPANARDLPAFESELPVGERIASFLTQNGKAKVSEIRDVTGIATDSIRSALYRGLKKGTFVILSQGGGKGREAVWGVSA